MRRWNGWGDDSIDYPLPGNARRFLETLVGIAAPVPGLTLEQAAAQVPESRLPTHPQVQTGASERLRHARGQSLPDWLALRCGPVGPVPDGVAYPQDADQVRALLRFAQQSGACVIPYGGGTSVVGHLTPDQANRQPVLSLDLSRMNRLLNFDPHSLLASFGVGVSGPDLEAQLRSHGCTLGHFPQSFEYSTLGGWVATRSSGQQSLRYGRIEKLFAGGRLVSPIGDLELLPAPASAAGPDLREMVLGSEGRLGVITEATVRASPLPEKEEFHAVFFPDFTHGQEAVMQILQKGIPVSMLRMSTAAETTTTLALAGHEALISGLEKLLALRGLGSEKCMLIAGFTGQAVMVRAARQEALAETARHGGVHIGRTFGDQWHKNRFRTPYLRNTLWEKGYAIDTLETAVGWSRVPTLLPAIETELRTVMQSFGERVHVFTHLSHVYPYGSSIYTTFLFRLAADPQETLQRWQAMKRAASQLIVSSGGTISHQHGVGRDHRAYLPAEKGELGMQALRQAAALFDPQGIMNPGAMFE